MANTDVYVNKITLPKDRSNTYTGILVDTASQKPWFGTSTTSALTQTKTVTCSGFYLQTGAIISIAFTYANTYTSAKLILNVNSTGAKDVYYNNAVTSSTNTLLWDAGEQVTFMYNGTGYYFVTKSKGGAVSDIQIGGTSILSNGVANIVTNSAYNSSTNKIATMNDLPSQTPTLCWYGTCSTDAATATKVVTCSNYVLNKGNIIGILFSTANTAATPTLNINSTGNKNIYIGTSTPNSTTNVLKWSANTMIYFMYDGSSYWYLYANASANTLQPRGSNTWYGTSNTNSITQAKESTIDNFVLTYGTVVVIRFTTANTYTSAKITLNINSTGAKDIYYNGAVTSSTNNLLWDNNTTLTFIYDSSGYYQFVSASKPEPLGASPGVIIRTWS